MAGIYNTINQQINQRRKGAGLVTAEYANPYELVYQQSKSNPFFTEQDWDKFKRRGELDGYLGILQTANETLDYAAVSNDYGFKWIDDDTRFNAIWNELNKNDLQEKSMRYEERYNYDTERYDKIEIGEMTDYEYNRLTIDQIKTAEVDKFKHQMAEDIKNNRSGFGKFMGTALSTLILGPLSGATEAVDNMTTVFAGLGGGVESVLNGGRFDEGFGAAFGETDAYGDILKGADGQVFQGLRDALMDFESQYSWVRDLDGQYTNYGKIAGGVGTSLGKILPSMAMNFIGGKFVEAGGKGATYLGKASEALYYTSLGSGTFKDLVNDPSMVSVPTYQLMLNAAAKTATEWAVQKALSKAFGTTALDKMTFGQKGAKISGGTSLAKVSKKVLLDAAHEGLEELTQDFSSYLWDRAFGAALNDKFGQMAEWNMQTAIDAFVLGALSVVASSAFSIAKAPRVSRGPQIDADGNIVYDKKGRVKQDFVGKFTSWIYRADMASMTENFNEALKNDKLTKEQRQDVVGQMYAAMRTITSIYGDIGEQRVAEAEALLKEMQTAAAKLELTDEQIKANATAIYEKVATIDKAYTKAQTEKVINAIINKGMTKTSATHERGQDIVMDMPQDIQDAVVKTITDLYKADPKLNKIVMTEDGTGPVFDDFSGTLFAPKKYLVNTDGRMVLEHVAEQRLVETIETTKDKRIQGVLTELKRIFEQSTNRTDVDMSEVIYNIMFNDSFYRIALSTSNAQMYQFLSHLDTIEKEATADIEKNAIYKKKINTAKKNIGVALSQWLILQQNANYSDLTILTKEHRAFIQKHRYGKDLANRVINGDSLSQADVDLLRARINSMPASPEVKLDIMKQLGFTPEWNRTVSTPFSRSLGIHALNQTYADFFVTPFNGQKYMQSTTLQNNIFNEWLMTNDLDLESLLLLDDKAFKEAQDMFKDRTGGAYEFLIVDGKIALKATRFQNVASYKEYQKIREQIKSGRPRMQVIERTLTTIRDGRGYLNALIGNKVDAASKGFMTLTEVIADPSVLKENLKQKILDYYGRVNSYTAFLYLRDYTLEETGTTSIVARGDGTFTYVDIRGMLDMLKDKGVTASQIGEVEKGNIKRLVKLEFLPEGSRLADVTVRQEGSESGYDADTNTITIAKTFPKSITDVDAYFRFALMHEFQHAVQTENNLNGGLNSSWLYQQDTSGKLHFSMPAEQAHKLISEVRTHRPDLFKDAEVINDRGQVRTYPTVQPGTEVEARIVQQFIYDTSGESQAMGTEGDDYIVDFYPTIVQHRDTVTTLTLPWGTQYQLGGMFQNLEIDSQQILPESEYQEYYDVDVKRNFSKEVPLSDSVFQELVPLSWNLYNEFEGNDTGNEYLAWITPEQVFESKGQDESERKAIRKIVNDQSKGAEYSKGDFKINRFRPLEVDLNSRMRGEIDGSHRASIAQKNNYELLPIIIRLENEQHEMTPRKLTFDGPGGKITVDAIPRVPKYAKELTAAFGNKSQQTEAFQKMSLEPVLSNNPLLTDTWDGNYDGITDVQFNEAIETVYSIVSKGLKDLYGDRVYFENDDYGRASPRVRAERRGDKAVLYHGTMQSNLSTEAYKEYRIQSEKDHNAHLVHPEVIALRQKMGLTDARPFSGDFLFASTVPEYSLTYGDYLYEVLMPWTEYETLSNAQVDADFDGGLDQEIWRATEHAVQRVIHNTENSVPEIKKIAHDKYNSTELDRITRAGQDGRQSFALNPRSQSLETPKQPGPERTRVTKTKTSANPRLKPFRGKLLSNDLQTLIVEADFAQLDPRVKALIDDGTLNTQRANNILRDTTKKINDYTFKLLNQYIYKNKHIKSITQLDKLTQVKASNYWAIREILRNRGALELLVEARTYTEFMDMLRTLEKNDALRRAFVAQRKIFENKLDKRGNIAGALDINRGNMRVAFIKAFDGTIDTAGAIADIARKAAIAGVGSTIDVQTTRGGLEKVSRVVAAKNADPLSRVLATESVHEKELRITRYKMERWAEDNPDATHIDMLRQMNKVKGELVALLDEAIDAGTDHEGILDFYISEMFITEVFDVKGEDIDIVADVPIYTRTVDSIRENLLRHARGFRDHISNKEFAKLDPEIQAMFDENRRLKRDNYDTRTYLEDDGKTIKRVGKTREQVLELEEMMKVLHKQARDGDFKNKTRAEMTRQLDKAKEQLAKEKGRRILAEGKRKVEIRERTIVLNDKEFDITSDVDIPTSLKDILDTTFDEFSKAETTHLTGASELKNAIINYVKQKQLGLDTSDIDVLVNALINTTVQGRGVITEDTFKETIRNNRNNARFAVLTDYDATNVFNLYNEGIQERIKSGDRNMKMNLRKFFEANAQRLQGLSQSEIDLIVEFYEKANLTGRNISRDDIRKFDAFQIYMLSYILRQSRQNVWKLTAAQIKAIENKLELMASMAGTNLSVWRAAIDIVDPNKTILQSIERSSGVELRESDIAALSKAMQKGDIKAVQDAQAEMLRHALEDNAGRKRSVWTKLWAFQRMAMLSGPGTWARNHISNALVTVGNDASASLGNLFAKKHRKQGQYIIAGTKVDTNTKNFINTNVIDNGFLDSVMDGLSKYDTRHTRSRTTGADVAIDMLARAVETQVLNHAPLSKNQKTDKALRAIPNFIMKMLSDDPFIKMRTKSYLGKMLVEDKIDLTKRLSHEVLTTLSEAYTAACFDYMRKPNAFSKMEAKLKESGGDAAYFAYKQIFPFMSASWNWFAEGLRYTPLGLAKAILDFARLENTIDKIERQRLKGEHVMSSRFTEYLARRNIGKGIIGSIGMGIGLLLGAVGVAEIEDDDDKIKLRVFDYSIDISGVFGSQSIMIGMALTNPRKAEEYNFIAHMTDVLDTLADDSIMSDMYNTFRFNDSTGEWLLDQPNRTLGMFIPNFLKTVTSLTYNHQIQYSKGFIGRVERTIAQGLPGIAHAFPKRTDPYTGEVMSRFKLPFLIDFMNRMLPVKLSDNFMSEAEKNALAVGVGKGELTGRYEDIDHFNAKQKSALNVKYGELNKSTLADLETGRTKYRVEMPDGKYKEIPYAQMDDIQKKRVIDRLMSDNARYAKVFIYTNGGGKYVASSSDYKALKKLGITKNVTEENKRKNLSVGFS